MFDVRIRALAEKWLPKFLLRILDPFEARVTDRLSAFVAGLPRNANVLDSGAGQCRYAKFFSGHRYLALDSGVGDRAWDYSRLDVIGDLEQAPLASASFDAAINIVVLEHAREPRLVLCELARLLRPGGRLFLVAPHQWEVHQAPHDFFRYTRYGLEYLLSQANFCVESLDPVGGFFWLMSRRCINLLTFFQEGLRWLVFILLAPFFGFLFPSFLYFLDPLDRGKESTLGYVCVARRRP